jgi:hypothetical protein
LYRQKGTQNSTEYDILDAKLARVAEVAASVRLAWPHLTGNPPDYDKQMESIFRAFLDSINGRIGPMEAAKDEAVLRPAP